MVHSICFLQLDAILFGQQRIIALAGSNSKLFAHITFENEVLEDGTCFLRIIISKGEVFLAEVWILWRYKTCSVKLFIQCPFWPG